ncbi:MAG: hypothetical protein ACR2HP_11300 [Ilumatobacteraceae bacterium]
MSGRGPARFAHLRSLIDDVGIWQHANGAEPAREHGYCLDDASRALLVTARLARLDPSWRPAVETCCRFVDAAMASTNGARNFMDADGRWLDDPHPGDHVGRTVWALGTLSAGRDRRLASWAAPRLRRLLDGELLEAGDLHGRLYALPGIGAAAEPWMAPLARQLATSVVSTIPDDDAWRWPEPRLRYDAGRMPEALLIAGATFSLPAAVDTGRVTLSMLTDLVVQSSGVHRYPGHRGLGPGEPLDESGDEQPLEAAAFAAAHMAARRVLGCHTSASAARAALGWFHGANRLGLTLIDPFTDGCHDGLGREARNDNQGAESTLAYAACWLDVCAG